MRGVKRLVVKVGTSSLAYPNGNLNVRRMERIVRQVSDLRNRGLETILVTSGAIAAGVGRMGLAKRPSDLAETQALAAIGQGILMHMYEKLFSEYGHPVAQVLLTREDVASPVRYHNVHNTFEALLRYGVVPIVNENDTVAVDEIKFGDNDTLSALVAVITGARLLILLSDVEGLYSGDPRKDSGARLIPLVSSIDDSICHCAGGAGSGLAVGGMATKIEAARIATGKGVYVVVASSEQEEILERIIDGAEVGTLFLPQQLDHIGQRRQGCSG
ncbi:MAG TPA: glutamate 5-kinase [Firmicutes bacterium]|nr:glutamate 5-kinase [Bacillota bacterium]